MRRDALAPLPARPTTLDDTAAHRGHLIGILKLAQAAGDTFHIRAMRLVLKSFDDRARAARRLRKGGRHASAS